jgi:adenosylhomocysteine nucleosidase
VAERQTGAAGSGAGSREQGLTVIVAAMREEVSALLPRLLSPRRLTVTGVDATVGQLGATAVAVAVTGDGERNARCGLSALLAAVMPVRRVIAIGVAGGLHPSLERAAVVSCANVIDAASARLYHADAALVVAAAASGARRGVAVTAARIADTVEEKRRLLALATARVAADVDAAASELAAVVDLESAVFAAAADRSGLPWLVLRAVSDTADEALPPLLNNSRDQGGAVRRGRVVRALLGNPGALAPLLALRQRVLGCADILARAVVTTLEAAEERRATPPPAPPAPAVVHLNVLPTEA